MKPRPFLELKSQVLKKQQEAEAARTSQGQKRTSLGKEKIIPTKRNVTSEEAEAWEKSRESLERKARLYEQLQRGEIDVRNLPSDSQPESTLVDFDRKGWDEKRQEYVGVLDNLKPEDPFEFFAKLYNVPKSESLVEYIDEFGRTRMIRPEEKAILDAEQAETRQLLLKLDDQEDDDGITAAQPMHYQADREIRDKGIGFFNFSKDEQERQRQIKSLDELRKATVKEREKFLIMKEQKRLRMQSRMALIEERRKAYNIDPTRGFE